MAHVPSWVTMSSGRASVVSPCYGLQPGQPLLCLRGELGLGRVHVSLRALVLSSSQRLTLAESWQLLDISLGLREAYCFCPPLNDWFVHHTEHIGLWSGRQPRGSAVTSLRWEELSASRVEVDPTTGRHVLV